VAAPGLLLAPAACEPFPGGTSGTSGTGGGVDGGEGGVTTAEGLACQDTANVYGNTAVRCGATSATAARDKFIKDVAKGDCDSVTIRNERELRATCLPSLSRIPCADFLNARPDPNCAEQIVAD